MKSISKKTLSFLVAAFALTTVYQNCAPAVFQQDLASSENPQGDLSIPTDSFLSNQEVVQPGVCSEENSLSFTLNFEDGVEYLCFDNTRQAQPRNGEICAGGPKIKGFNVPGRKVSCDLLTVCGVAAQLETSVDENKPGFTKVKYIFRNLPLGCEGQVHISKVHEKSPRGKISEASDLSIKPESTTEEKELKVINIAMSSGSCRFCEQSRSFSCGACGDTEVPETPPTPPTPPAPADCVHAQLGTIKHGASISAFSAAQVSFGSTCQSETRTCNNGVLSGSYTHKSCAVNSASSCTVEGLGTIAHGSSITAFSTASVPYGSTCQSQVRACNNGTLSGSFSQKTCTVAPPATCNVAGLGNVAHGASVTAFATASVPFGSTCQSQVRTCNNGTLTGSYSQKTCVVSPAASCAVDGLGTVAHGSSITAFSTASVPFGGTCQSQVRACNNGTLSGTYSQKNCTVTPPAACNVSGLGTVAHGANITAFATASVPFGGTCQSQVRACNNGTLSGSYSNKTCAPEAPKSCSLAGFGTIAHGASITAYNVPAAANGTTCKPEVRTCNNGILSGSQTVTQCTQTYYKTSNYTHRRSGGNATFSLGNHLRCNLVSFQYDGDGKGDCIVSGTPNGAWSLVVRDEGSSNPMVCNVTCTDIATASTGQPVQGATCTSGGANGIVVNSCCAVGTRREVLFSTTGVGKNRSTRQVGTFNDVACKPL